MENGVPFGESGRPGLSDPAGALLPRGPAMNRYSRTNAPPGDPFGPDLRKDAMTSNSTLSLPELEDRIAIVRDNLRQLVEQAAAASGGADEDRNADRIAQQTEELKNLTQARDALLKK